MAVFLIAGPSSVGKTTAARRISADIRATIWSVDDLAKNHPHPALAFEKDEATWAAPPEDLCGLLIEKGQTLWPEIETYIHESETQSRAVIIDGEGPDPESVKGLPARLNVAAVFVVELDVQRLDQTLSERSARYRLLPPAHRTNVALMNVRYGEWLVEESERVGVPWIHSRPWPTLADRTRLAWNQASKPPDG